MFNIGGGELLVILLLALIVLGPQKLPGAVRTAGRVMGEVRRVSSGFQQELKTAFDDVDDGGDGGDLPRRRESAPLAGAVAEAEAEARAPSDDDDEIADAPPAPRPVGGDSTQVPPPVAAALDEIVTPLTSSPVAPATNSSRDDDTDEASGDERAAS
jgi:sec-independent protein translocase protein TatB